MLRFRNIHSILVSVLTAAVFVVGITTTEAARKDPGLAGHHLTIEEVQVDLSNDPGQLTIKGEHFSFANTLAVRLGVSDELLTVVGVPTDTEIVVNLPADLPGGDYLLTVSTGNGPSQNDEFDLTIGAVADDEGGFPCTDGGTPVGDRWVVSESGLTVCDKNTGTTWQQYPLSTTRNWDDSIAYCPTLGAGWELPEYEVLFSLVDTTSSTCDPGELGSLCLPDGHPFDNVQSAAYWSASTNGDPPTTALVVNFGLGAVSNFIPLDSNYHAWCARSD